MELYATASGYGNNVSSLSVPDGTAVTFYTTTWGYNPSQTLMYVPASGGGPYWTGNPQYAGYLSETVTGPNNINYDAAYGTGSGTGTAYFQVWNGTGSNGGSNIVSVTWW